MQRFFPWTLEGATPETTAAVLGLTPPPVQQAYRDEWQPSYAALTLFSEESRRRAASSGVREGLLTTAA